MAKCGFCGQSCGLIAGSDMWYCHKPGCNVEHCDTCGGLSNERKALTAGIGFTAKCRRCGSKMKKEPVGSGGAPDNSGGSSGSSAAAIGILAVVGLVLVLIVAIVQTIIAMLPYLIAGGIIIAVSVFSYRRGGFAGLVKGVLAAVALCATLIFGLRLWSDYQDEASAAKFAAQEAQELKENTEALANQKQVAASLFENKAPFAGRVGGPFAFKEFYGNPALIYSGKKKGRRQDLVVTAQSASGLFSGQSISDVRLAAHQGGLLMMGNLDNGETDPKFREVCLAGIEPIEKGQYLTWADCRRADGESMRKTVGVLVEGQLVESIRKSGDAIPKHLGVYRRYTDGKCAKDWDAWVIGRSYLTHYNGGTYISSHVLKEMNVQEDGTADFQTVYGECSGSIAPLTAGRLQVTIKCAKDSKVVTLCREEKPRTSKKARRSKRR